VTIRGDLIKYKKSAHQRYFVLSSGVSYCRLISIMQLSFMVKLCSEDNEGEIYKLCSQLLFMFQILVLWPDDDQSLW